MTLNTPTRGFTLLETVIYIGLFSLLMTGVLVTVYQLLESGTHNRTAVGVQEEGTFVNRKLYWALAGATSTGVSVPNAQTLVIIRPDLGSQSPVRVMEQDGQMLIQRGSGAAVPLTTSEYVVSNTEFSVVPSATGVPPSVRVRYEVKGTPFLFRTYLRE